MDTKNPAVESVMPAENARGISAGADINAVFSEAMRPRSVNASTVKLFEKGSSVPLATQVSYEAATNRAILNPDTALVVGKTYRALATNVRCGSSR